MSKPARACVAHLKHPITDVAMTAHWFPEAMGKVERMTICCNQAVTAELSACAVAATSTAKVEQVGDMVTVQPCSLEDANSVIGALSQGEWQGW